MSFFLNPLVFEYYLDTTLHSDDCQAIDTLATLLNVELKKAQLATTFVATVRSLLYHQISSERAFTFTYRMMHFHCLHERKEFVDSSAIGHHYLCTFWKDDMKGSVFENFCAQVASKSSA